MSPLNEYDDLLVGNKATPGGAVNEYADMLDQDRAQQKTALQGSMFVAAKAQPDRQAQVMKLSESLKIPTSVVDRNFDDLSKRNIVQDTDYDGLIENNPKLTQWLQDPNQAAVSHDDIDGLKGVERTVQDHGMLNVMYRSLGSGLAALNASVARVPGTAAQALYYPQNLIAGALDKPEWQVNVPEAWVNNPVAKYYDQQSEGFKPPEMDRSITEEIGKGNFSRAGMTLAAQFVANAPQQAALIVGTLSGLGIPALLGAGATTAASKFGETLASNKAAEDARVDVGPNPAPVSQTQAIGNALAQGTIEAAFERLGTFGVLKSWENAIAKQYGKQVSREVMKDLGKTMAYSFAAEGNEEALTSIAQDFSDYITGVNPNALTGIAQRALDAGIVGGASGGLMTAPSAVAAGQARQAQARHATMQRDFYLSMGKSAEATKLRERLPEGQRKYVESIVKDSPVENVYIPVEAAEAYFQSKNVNPAAAMQGLGVLQSFNEAKETGGAVEIPLAQWVSQVVGTDDYVGLANDIKFSPNDLTVNESKRAGEEAKKQLEAEAQAAEAPVPESAQKDSAPDVAQAQAASIRATITDQLKAAGQDEKTADTYAQVYESAFKTLAERSGVNPLELFSRYGLQIRGEGQEAQPADPNAPLNLNQSIAAMQPPNPNEATREINTEQVLDQSPLGPSQLDDFFASAGSYDNWYEETRQYAESDLSQDEEWKDLSEEEREQRVSDYISEAEDNESDNTMIFFREPKEIGSTWLIRFSDKDPVEFAKKVAAGSLEGGAPDRLGLTFHESPQDGDLAFGFTLEDAPVTHSEYGRNAVLIKVPRAVSADHRSDGERQTVFDVNEVEAVIPLRDAGKTWEVLNENGEPLFKANKKEKNAQKIVDTIAKKGGKYPVAKGKTKVLFQPGEDSPRGQIKIGKQGINIDLLKDADLSTFLHESGHFYLEVLGDLATAAEANPEVKADYEEILKWLGVESRAEIKTDQHEQFARGFEAYLMEGKAPSSALREAFTRFRVWLTNIYRKLTQLDVQLTPEVKRVFDRMIATDEEITAAQNEQGMTPLFSDPASFGMNGPKAEAYKKAVAEAKLSAENLMSERMMDDIVRTKTAWWNEQRQSVEAEITEQINAQPIYQAISILQDGTLPDGSPAPQAIKIDRKSLIDEFGKDIVSRLPKNVTAKDGVHFDIAANALKFDSGTDLIAAMEKTLPREEAIQQATDERMNELHPEFFTDIPARHAEAMQDIHSDQRAKVLRMELEHLAEQNLPQLKEVIRRIARKLPTEKIVRAEADKIVGAKLVRDIKPHIYQAAERKAAKEAGEMLAKGDLDGAFQAKRRELLNHELFRSASSAIEQVKKQDAKFKKISKTTNDAAKTRDMDLVHAAQAVLASYGVGQVEKPVSEYLKPLERYAPDVFETMNALVDNAIATSGMAVSYRDIPYNDFQTLATSVDAMWDLSRRSKQIEIDGQKVDREEQQAKLQARISELLKPGSKGQYTETADKWDKAKMGLMGARAALRRVESWVDAMDGGDPAGVFRSTIWNPISEGTAKYRIAKQQYIQKYLDVVKGIEKSITYEDIIAPEIGHKFKGKAELLHALLHTGNLSNKTKLLQGWGWGEVDADGTLDSSMWDAFVKRAQEEGLLTKADYDYAQATWDLLEELKTPAQQAHKDMYGYYFNEITAEPLVTPYGQYRGGYVPAIADPFLVEDQNIRNEKEALEKSNNSFMFPTSGRGFTKSRVEGYTVPLALDLRYIPGHIDKVLRFVHIEPHVKDVGRIVMDKGFRKALSQLDPTVGGDMLVPWLQRAAQQKVVNASQGWGGRAADTIFREIRTRTGFNVMVGNVVNTFQQVTGLSIAALKVKPRYLRNALWSYVRGPSTLAASVNEKSEFMQTRTGSQVMEIQQTIDDLLLQPSKYEQARSFASKHGYFLQSQAQNVVDLMVWSGAYDQAVESGVDEKQAVRQADSAVRQTQGSFNAEDISRFETGTPFMRAFTMFYSYFNMQANLLGSEFAIIARSTGLRKGAGRALYVYALGFMMPAVMSELIVQVMSGKGLDEDDDDQYLDDMMSIFFGAQRRAATAFFPGVGQAVNAGFNSFNDKWYDDRISSSPAVAAIESAVSAPHSIYMAITEDGSRKKAIRDGLTALGLLTGLPAAPLARPLGYLSDVAEGKVQPSGPVDFTRGLITGKGATQ